MDCTAKPQRPSVNAGNVLVREEDHSSVACVIMKAILAYPKNSVTVTQSCTELTMKEVRRADQSMQLTSVEPNGGRREELLDAGNDQTLIQPQGMEPRQ